MLTFASSVLARPGVKQALAQAARTLSSKKVVGEAGSGMVRATLGGDGRIIALEVNPSIGKEGSQAIAELVSAAVNRAHDRLREETRKTIMESLPPNVEPSMLLRATRP